MINKILSLLFLALTLPGISLAQGFVNLTPAPKSMTTPSGELVLPNQFTVNTSGLSTEMTHESQRFAADLTAATGLQAVTKADAAALFQITVNETLGDEAYKINVKAEGVNIEAKTAKGLFYAFQSIKKVLPANVMAGVKDVAVTKYALPILEVDDAPRYGYRGFMLDTSRHFFSVKELKRVLDVMAYYKMNTFHWHLTDDHGWRVEIKKYPKLTSVGSVSETSYMVDMTLGEFWHSGPYGPYFYTQEEVKEVVAYAKDRHITIIPEIDMPGHFSAAMAAYPEYSCNPAGPHKVITERAGVFKDILNVGNPEAVQFAKDILTEIMEMFPGDQIHIGGDECPTDGWQQNAQCKARMKELGLGTNWRGLQSHFIKEMADHVKAKGRKLAVWNEAITAKGALTDLVKETGATVYCWVGGQADQAAKKAAELGLPHVYAPQPTWYIQRKQSEDPNEPVGAGNGKDNLEVVYNKTIPTTKAELFKGVQACFWSEFVAFDEYLEYLMLPRLVAVAEAGWSPQAKRVFKDFQKRISADAALFDYNHYNYGKHYILANAPTLDEAMAKGKLLTAEQLNQLKTTKRLAIQLISQSTKDPNPKDAWFKVNANTPHFQKTFNSAVYVDWIPTADGKHVMKFVDEANGFVQNTEKLQLGAEASAQAMSVVMPVTGGSGDATLGASDFLPDAKYAGYFCRFVRNTDSYINANQSNWHNGKGEWTVFFVYELENGEKEEVVPTEDYYSIVPEGMGYRDPKGRRLQGVSLTVNGKQQTQMLAEPLTVYTKALDRQLKVKAGDVVTPTFEYFIQANNPWMHGFVYVDFGKDGQFSAKVVDNKPAEGSDLVSYSYYNGFDSKGNAAPENGGDKSKGHHIFAPSFAVPAGTAPGLYRMRYKVDWSNIDPAGSKEIVKNPGAICDVILNVHGDVCQVNGVDNEWGSVVAADGSALPKTVPFGQDFQVKLKAKKAGSAVAARVRHGFGLDGEAVVDGVTLWKEHDVIAGADNVVTIPADYMDGDVQIVPVESEYVMIFADEFNGENMSQPNEAVWHRSPRWGSVWNRLVSKQNDVVYVKDGNLVCRAIKNDNPLPGEETPTGTNMRTGAVETSGKFAFRYGKVECRAKASLFQGTFPAIWMMPADGTGGWPSCGEIDIFEAVNTESKAHHTVHTNWTYNAPKHPATHNENVNFDDFHVYGLEWDDRSLTFFLDGVEQWKYTKDTAKDAVTRRQWPFNRDFYLILNQSVGRGNDWAKEPDPNHTYEFLVDWIRVYQNPHHAAMCELRAKIEEFDERLKYAVDGFREGKEVCEYTFDNEALAAARTVLADADNKSVDELKAALKSLDCLYVLNQPQKNHFYRMRCADDNMRYIQSSHSTQKVDDNREITGLDLKKNSEDGIGAGATFLYTDKGMLSYAEGLYCSAESLMAAGKHLPVTFEGVRNGRLGAYNIKMGDNYVNGKYNVLDIQKPTNDLNNRSSNWWLEEVKDIPVNFVADAALGGAFASIYSPVALQLPEGVQAYQAVVINPTAIRLLPVEGNVVPAGKAVVLKTDAEGVKVLTMTDASADMDLSSNQLVGSAETTPCGNKAFFAMQKKGDVLAFCAVTGGSYKGFSAVMAKPEGSTVDVFQLTYEDLTGIDAVAGELPADAVIYDLSGRRVAEPVKGIYIVNGKKMYVK